MQIFAVASGDFLMKLVWAWSYKVLKSTLVQVMARYREATSHNLIQCWTKSMSSLGPNELKIEKLSILFLYSQILYLAHTLHIDEHVGMHIVVDTKRSFDPHVKEQTNENGRFMIFFLFLMIILSYWNHDTVVTSDLCLANRRRCYNVTLSPIGQMQCSK